MTALILVYLLTTVTLATGAGMLFVGQMLRHGEPRPLPHVEVTDMSSHQAIAARIEIADLRARIKRLEAIAEGVDL